MGPKLEAERLVVGQRRRAVEALRDEAGDAVACARLLELAPFASLDEQQAIAGLGEDLEPPQRLGPKMPEVARRPLRRRR